MTRGFVTIATGKDRYYLLARNLLRSYRQWSRQDTPFALICEEENEYTKEFNKVIVMENPTRSFADKLQLYRYLPYDETIFIDADSLIYADINGWWDVLTKGSDFASFGIVTELKPNTGWFDCNRLGEFRDKVSYMPVLQGGVYFLRRSERCRKVFELAEYFKDHYYEYGFLGYTDSPADEPILSLCMAIEQCKPIRNMPRLGVSYVCNMPHFWNLQTNILIPYARNKIRGMWVSSDIIHWGNRNTRYFSYQFDADNLNDYLKNPKTFWRTLLYTMRLKKLCLFFADFQYLPERLKGRIKFLK